MEEMLEMKQKAARGAERKKGMKSWAYRKSGLSVEVGTEELEKPCEASAFISRPPAEVAWDCWERTEARRERWRGVRDGEEGVWSASLRAEAELEGETMSRIGVAA